MARSERDRFSFYQRWFDTVFLVSGCVTAVTLAAFHLANRTSDADHHPEAGSTRTGMEQREWEDACRDGPTSVGSSGSSSGGPSGFYFSSEGREPFSGGVRTRGRETAGLLSGSGNGWPSSGAREGAGPGGAREAAGGHRSKQA